MTLENGLASTVDFVSTNQVCKISKGVGKAPKEFIPNSVYYKLDNATKKKVVSKTVYNKNGQPKFRVDLDHSHFDETLKKDLTNGHKHIFEYNSDGRVIKPIKAVPIY